MAKSSFKRPTPPAKAGAAKPAAKPTPKGPAAAPAKKPVAPTPAKAGSKRPAPPPGVRTNVVPPKVVAPPAEPVEAEVEVVEEENDTVAAGSRVAVRENEGELGFNLFSAPVGQPVGEYDAGDFDLPKLKLAQRVGPLTEELGFSYGDWVLNDEAIIWQDGCEPVELTVLRWQKGFMQSTAYGSDEMGKLYNTAPEAIADGLIPFGGDDVGFVPYQNALVLIKQPEGVECSVLTHEFNGVMYAVALWRITGSAYSHAAKKINNQARLRLKGGLHTGAFLLEAREVQGKQNSYMVPVLKDGGMHDQEFVEFAVKAATGEV